MSTLNVIGTCKYYQSIHLRVRGLELIPKVMGLEGGHTPRRLPAYLNVTRLIRPGSAFQSSTVQCWWARPNCSLTFLFLAFRSGTCCGLVLLQPTCCKVQRVVCMQRGSSALTANINKTFSPRELPLAGCFLSFFSFRYSLWTLNTVVWGNSQQYSDEPIWHQQACHIQSHFGCSAWPCLHTQMHRVAPIGWLNKHINEQLSRCSQWVCELLLNQKVTNGRNYGFLILKTQLSKHGTKLRQIQF